MISVKEAKKIIGENIGPSNPKDISIAKAAGHVLASDIYAGNDIPAFRQSSMDGYAFLFSDWQSSKKLFVDGESVAGSNKKISIIKDQAVRIFTGAPVPAGADTVVMQEKVTVTNGELIIADHDIKPGTNVRPAGSEIKAGSLAMSAGSYLTPAAIGFLAGMGCSSIPAHPKPRVSIIVTGKELQQPGIPLEYGQVYESNSLALRAALQQIGITDVSVFSADDDPDILTETLRGALNTTDLVLLAGGISVGDYDFVAEATRRCGVTQRFHKIKQRPGKPLFFGTHEKKPVFGLPGNPSSVLTCFYEYVILCVEQMTQRKSILKKQQLPISRDFQKNINLTHFLKGYSDGITAMPLEAQESYRMSSYAVSNCLIVLEEEKQVYAEGEKVEVHFLPE